MKKIIVITIVLSSIMMNGFTQEIETKAKKTKISTSEVYAIHEIELKADADTKEFETFVMKELALIYNKMKGQKLFLVKGDRGIRTGKYAIILTFDTIEDRDRIYPPSGGFVGDFGDESIWERFNVFIVKGLGESFTDYVKIDQ